MSTWAFSPTSGDGGFGACGGLWESVLEPDGYCLQLPPSQFDSPVDYGDNFRGATVVDSSTVERKLSHNACERDRRKKLNGLYSSLRSLLPRAVQQKKLSIPCTVYRALEYIPELQKSVGQLKRRKEELLSKTTRRGIAGQPENGKNKTYPVVSATCVGDREVMIQICTLPNGSNHCSISKVLACLERQGLQLIHASTSNISGGRASQHLHLQANNTVSVEAQKLRSIEKTVTETMLFCSIEFYT